TGTARGTDHLAIRPRGYRPIRIAPAHPSSSRQLSWMNSSASNRTRCQISWNLMSRLNCWNCWNWTRWKVPVPAQDVPWCRRELPYRQASSQLLYQEVPSLHRHRLLRELHECDALCPFYLL